MTQRDMVLEHLQQHGSITQKDAIELFGAYRLSAIIFDLREQGHKIDTVNETKKNRYGKPTTFARYIYQEEQMRLAL